MKNPSKVHYFLTDEWEASLYVQKYAQEYEIVPSPIPSESSTSDLLEMQTIKVLKCPCINHLRLKLTWESHEYSSL